MPVVLVAGVLAFFFLGDEDDETAPSSEVATLPIDRDGDGEDDGATPVVMDGEVTDVARFCAAYDYEVGESEPQEWDEIRAEVIKQAPVVLEQIDEMKASTSGALRSDLDRVEAYTIETRDVFESLPTSEYDLTEEHRDLMLEMDGKGRFLFERPRGGRRRSTAPDPRAARVR